MLRITNFSGDGNLDLDDDLKLCVSTETLTDVIIKLSSDGTGHSFILEIIKVGVKENKSKCLFKITLETKLETVTELPLWENIFKFLKCIFSRGGFYFLW